ncbi:hypothetical protein M8J76_017177 [Diaphorina citri]|nr:hypothetical protein M8J76_017177 [Diaphorina citri]
MESMKSSESLNTFENFLVRTPSPEFEIHARKARLEKLKTKYPLSPNSNDDNMRDTSHNVEEVLTEEQFVMNDKTRIPAVTKQSMNACDALRALGSLIKMTNFKTDPLELWFLSRLIDALDEAQTKALSQELQKSMISWLGFVLYRIINRLVIALVPRPSLNTFVPLSCNTHHNNELISCSTFKSSSRLRKWRFRPISENDTNISRAALFEEIKTLLLSSLRVFVQSQVMPTPMDVLKHKQNPSTKAAISLKSGSVVTTETQKKDLAFLTTWIYRIFADSATFESVRLLMALRKKILTL